MASHQTEMARVIRERDEALEQQTAISDILRVISNSPSDVQPVLDSVAEHAARICEAQVVDIVIVDNEVYRQAASFGELGRLSSGEAVPLDRSSVTGRSICDLQPVHIADIENASDEFPLGREFATRFGHRTILSAPLIREGHALGAILVRRSEVRPFEQKHIAAGCRSSARSPVADKRRGLHCRRLGGAGPKRPGKVRWRAVAYRSANAQGECSGRCHHHLPPRGSAVHRQADRASQKFPPPRR